MANTDEKRRASDFLKTVGSFEYPQPLVVSVTGANEVDINRWRLRKDKLLNSCVKIGSRVFHSGIGLIQAGLMNELYQTFGSPAKASFMARSLSHDHAEDVLRNPDKKFVIVLKRGGDEISSDEREKVYSWDQVGLSPYRCEIRNFKVNGHHPEVVIPISSLILQWAFLARWEIEEPE